MFFDLHRHDEASSFDGFGKPEDLAKIAKELGYKALGISNHGTANTLIRHYFACKEQGIKPVLGVEGYFLPKFNPEKKRRGYHLCLFAKNVEGYQNICRILSEAEDTKYYNGIITMDNLKRHSEGIVVTSACIAGPLSQLIIKNKIPAAEKLAKAFKSIFKEDFYIEIQPYKISEPGLQETVNEKLMNLAKKLDIKCILTSDSHYGRKEDFSTYLKMHEISKHDIENIRKTYNSRYMPSEAEISKRFIKMHPKYKNELKTLLANMGELYESIEDEIFEKLKLKLPKFDETQDSFELLTRKVKQGLKDRGKWNKQYWDRAKQELEVIKTHGFEDYFLIVQDYIAWAKEQGITVGPGRGSGCNSIVNYALKITDVDSIKYKLYFGRFLRIDKVKLPDIDIDFDKARRGEVMQYMKDKYGNRVAQVCSYGLYQSDSLLNDLCKVCNVDEEGKARIKRLIKSYTDSEGEIDLEELSCDPKCNKYNELYDDILIHFVKMHRHLRYIGTHAAGMVLTSEPISDYVPIKVMKDGKRTTAYDLFDLDKIKVVKFDFLGLATLEQIRDLREMFNRGFDDSITEDKEVLEAFRQGKTDGIFQYVHQTAKDILVNINADCFDDVCAASAMNRPTPLSLGIPQMYAENKANRDLIDNTLPWADIISDTYGTIIYQEQIQSIAIDIGGLEGAEADKILKMNAAGNKASKAKYEESYEDFWKKFRKGAKKHGVDKETAKEMFDKFFAYSFNKGHTVGYCLISFELMWYKVHHPVEFWATTLRYEYDELKRKAYEVCAAQEGIVILPAHINGPAHYEAVEWGGGKCIQRGYSSIKGIGEKAALEIEAQGPFLDRPDFEERVSKRICNKRVKDALENAGAFEFNVKKWKKRIISENIALVQSNLIVR